MASLRMLLHRVNRVKTRIGLLISDGRRLLAGASESLTSAAVSMSASGKRKARAVEEDEHESDHGGSLRAAPMTKRAKLFEIPCPSENKISSPTSQSEESSEEPMKVEHSIVLVMSTSDSASSSKCCQANRNYGSRTELPETDLSAESNLHSENFRVAEAAKQASWLLEEEIMIHPGQSALLDPHTRCYGKSESELQEAEPESKSIGRKSELQEVDAQSKSISKNICACVSLAKYQTKYGTHCFNFEEVNIGSLQLENASDFEGAYSTNMQTTEKNSSLKVDWSFDVQEQSTADHLRTVTKEEFFNVLRQKKVAQS